MGGKKVVYSGIQSTGVFTLGNYIGAIRGWGPLQDENDCLYSIVDLHALTVRQDPLEYKRRCVSAFAQLLAVGINPAKSILYFQSHVPQHAQLSWILNCYTYMGELQRMTQFKDKSEKHGDNINVGLFDYPVLMAADILLYNTSLVPVGADQKQHVELTRDIAIRFNNIYGDTFAVPQPLIGKSGSRIMSLTDPTRKMSKSDEETSYVTLLDPPDIISKRFKRAVTDSGSGISFGEDKPGISNLLTIFAVLNNITIAEAERRFDGAGYGSFKSAVADAVIAELEPVQSEYARIMAETGYIESVAKDGAERAAAIAQTTLEKVNKKIGLP